MDHLLSNVLQGKLVNVLLDNIVATAALLFVGKLLLTLLSLSLFIYLLIQCIILLHNIRRKLYKHTG